MIRRALSTTTSLAVLSFGVVGLAAGTTTDSPALVCVATTAAGLAGGLLWGWAHRWK